MPSPKKTKNAVRKLNAASKKYMKADAKKN